MVPEAAREGDARVRGLLGEGRQRRRLGRPEDEKSRGQQPRGTLHRFPPLVSRAVARSWVTGFSRSAPRSIHWTKVRTSSLVSASASARQGLRRRRTVDVVPGPVGAPPEQVPHQGARPRLARAHGPVEERLVGAGLVETRGGAAGAVAVQAPPLDDRPDVVGEVDEPPPLRGQGQPGRGPLDRLHQPVGRRPLGILVAADAAPGFLPPGPDPGAAAQREAVLVEQLQLHRGVRRHLDVEGAVAGQIHLAQETAGREAGRDAPVALAARAALDHPQALREARRPRAGVQVADPHVEAVEPPDGIVPADAARAPVGHRARGDDAGPRTSCQSGSSKTSTRAPVAGSKRWMP